DEFNFPGESLYRFLSILRRVADVIRDRANNAGEFLPEASHNFLRVIQRKSRLSQKSKPRRIGHLQFVNFLDAPYYNRLIRRLSRRDNDLLMVLVSDQNYSTALPGEFQGLEMHFGDQGTSGINHAKLALLRFGSHAWGNPVRAKHQHRFE